MTSKDILADETRQYLPTPEAARILGRSVATLHGWAWGQRACPIEPVRLQHGRLGWPVEKIRQLLEQGWLR